MMGPVAYLPTNVWFDHVIGKPWSLYHVTIDFMSNQFHVLHESKESYLKSDYFLVHLLLSSFYQNTMYL